MAKVQTNGMTITFATASSFIAKITAFSMDGETADDVENSDLSTVDFRTFEPGFIIDGGTYTYEIQVDVTDVRLATGVSDVATITYPVSVSGSTAAFRNFPCYINSYSEAGGINELITATLVIKAAGKVVFQEELV